MLSPFAERQMIEKSMNTGYDISEKRVLPDRRRSALKIMGSLIGLVKPLIHIMILAVLLGTAGYLCAIFLTILAGQILIQGLGHAAGTQGAMSQGLFAGMTPQNLFVLMILLASFGMLFFMLYLYGKQTVDLDGVVICTIAMMGSFGPVIALSNLSNNLNQTLASGERVLSVLEEKPQVEEIYEGEKDLHELEKEQENTFHKGSAQMLFAGAEASHVTFSYEEEEILRNYSVKIPAGKIVGIHGASGSGKSTLLKLLMRFWDADSGEVSVNGANVRRIPTRSLRDTESYVTQETHLFHDSIANNIAVGKPGASRQEIMEAAKKASVHDFIMSLPKGYDTEVGELGDTLSGGEKQRIGIARAFLHDAPFILMDEPTSKLDSLNEGIILKSLREEADKKTVVLVSHRKSTMNVADVMYEMENGRVS